MNLRSDLVALVLLGLLAAGCSGSGSTPPAPSLIGLSPAEGTPLGGTVVTLTAEFLYENLNFPLEVTFDGVPATGVTVLDPETATCIAPAGTPGASVEVEVTGPFGSDSVLSAYAFHPLPAVSTATMLVGSALGGDPITITGSGFLDNDAGAPTVTFDGVLALNLVVVDDSTITFDIPPGPPGATVDVVLTNDNGSAFVGTFTYFDAPAASAISVVSGTSLGGTAVTVTGTGFAANAAGANVVSFGGNAATSVVVVDDTTLTCVTPTGPPAMTVDVTVTNANGSGELTAAFTYFALPSVASIAPSSGTSLGAVPTTISGSGFVANGAGVNSVTFGGTSATGIVVVDDSTITCEAPAGPPGTSVDVRVDNANGSATLATSFDYHPIPTLSSIVPGSGTSLPGTAVTLSGSGFLDLGAGANSVTFGGMPATSITVVDDTTLTCVTPAGTAGSTVDVAITNENGTNALPGSFRYHALPTLTSVTPPAGSPLGGLGVTLSGTGFLVDAPGTNTVTFGGTPATSITVVNDTTITCTTPAGPDGTAVDVVVSNDNGSVTLPSGFIYNSSPLLVSVTPAQGSSLGGTSVTLLGTAFVSNSAGPNTVLFGGAAATSVVAVDDSTITCITPSGVAGASVDVSLSNANGTTTIAGGFTYHPLPTVTLVTPNSGTSFGGTSVTISGSGFQTGDAGANVVSFGGVIATSVVLVNDSMLTCETPTGTPGTTSAVSVENANGTGTLAGAFTFNPFPTVTSVAPSTATSLGGTSVTITGATFVPGAGVNTVTFGGVAATSVVGVDENTITCITPAGSPEASVDVVVTNINGAGTLASGFTYSALPTVTSITPAAGTSLGGTSVTISGTGFANFDAGANTVTFGSSAATGVVVVNDTTITCDTPSGTASTTVDLSVANTSGSGTLASAYSYHPTPTVSSFTPPSGTSLGGTSVTISGTGFTANSAGTNLVSFNGVAATSVVAVDDTTITCDTPAGPAGTPVSVSVSNANDVGDAPASFTYFPTPTVTGVTPPAGTSLGGTSVTVTGTGFFANAAGANTITFDGVAATGLIVVNDTTITCTTPMGVAGSAAVVSLSNDNGSGSLAGGFAYHPAPAVTSASPSSGSALGGTMVAVTGTGFTVNAAGTNTVTFDGVAATSSTVVSDTMITCTTPAGTRGSAVAVAVVNDNGTGSLGSGFSYYPRPLINSVSPSGGSSLGGTAVTVSGTGFVANSAGPAAVTFGGMPASGIVVVNDTTITCESPAGSAGATVDVVVSNGNGTAIAAGAFAYFAVPTVVSVTPAVGSSLGGTSVTLSGTGFVANAAGTNTITFGGVLATTVIVLNDTTITCQVPAGSPGAAVDVVVSNNNDSGTLSAGFTYHASPTVTSVSPASGTSLGGMSLTVSGSGFSANSAGVNRLTFGGALATNIVVVNDSTITCTAPSGAAGTTVDVELTNDNGTGTLLGGFTFHALPTLTAIAPASGTGLGGTAVTLTGTGFQDDSPGTNTVTFGGGAATSIVVVSDTMITCDTPGGTAGAAVDVALSNANGSATLAAAFTYFPAPAVTSVTPSSGPWPGGTSVTVTGTGFTANTAGSSIVEFGGVAATNVMVVSDTTITCNTPAGTPGADVVVGVTNDNGTGTLSAGYRYFAQPTLSSVSPASGSSLGGVSVTLTGSGFQVDSPGTNTVTFDGMAAANLMVVSDTTITCDTPPGTPGTIVDVVLGNDNGMDSLPNGFTYYSEPDIATISPSSGGSVGGTSITLSGRGFLANSAGPASVTFGGLAATNVTVLNDTTLTCETPAGTPASAVDVVLSNANGSDTLPNAFTYHSPPTLTSVAPTSGSSLGGQTVMVTGTGFLDNSAGANSVTFGGLAATELVVFSDTSLSCETPPGAQGATVDIFLQNSNGDATLASSFTYNALPTLTSVSPTAGTSLGGTSVTLTGSGFLNDNPGTNAVTFGGLPPTSVVIVSDTSITCAAPPGAAGSTVDVAVTNDNGAATLPSSYSFHSEPTLASVSPASGTSLASTSITLTGSGFTANAAGTNTVSFGLLAATNVMAVSDTSITCDAPAGTAGTSVDVSISNSNGSATLANGFRYHDEPILTSVSPAAGSPGGGTLVTIAGSGFQDDSPGTNIVTFGGVTATNIAVVSDTSITCDAPGGTAGAFVDVALSNDNGSDSLSNAFRFYPAPTLTAVSPDHGPDTGGAQVTLTGTGFQDNSPGANAVTFGGVAATNVVVVSDTSITCDSPAGTAGAAVDVALSNDNGSDTLTGGYLYHPLPTLTSVSPADGASRGGTAVTLTGTGFQDNDAGANSVSFGGAVATGLVVVSDTSITCTTPAGVEGTMVDVVVSNTNGSATLSNGFSYHAAPTLTGVAADFGQAAGSTSVTLTGTGFLDNGAGANTVTFGGSAPTNVVVVSDTSITCDTPSGPADSAVDVVLSNANGSVTLASGFTYNDPPIIGQVDEQWAEDGVAFSYTPDSSDPDASDSPVYSSTGTALPAWASLNTSTGEVSGMPGAADIGVTTTGIRISIDDGNYSPVQSGSFALAVSGAASQLAFDTMPASNEPQDEVWTPFTVRVEDSSGNLYGNWASPVTLSLTSGTGTLSGTLVQPTVDGIATFDDLSHDTVETVTFDLTSSGLTGIVGTSVTIDAGPTTKLAFSVQPSEREYRDVEFSYFVVEVQDASGTRITTDNSTQVDIALGMGGGTLSGTLSKTVTAGRAVFDDVSYDLAQIIALSASSTPATTTPTSEDVTVRALLGSGLPQVRASVDSGAGEANGTSSAPTVSSNGRYLAFSSDATDLVASDTNGVRDVFVHDRVSGDTQRVSLDSAGGEADGASDAPSISADGRFVAFHSMATDLVASDTNAVRDVFVHDRQTGETTRVSVDSSALQGDGESRDAALSGNGRFVVFDSASTNLVAGDSNASRDVFLHDRATGNTTRVSIDSVAGEANGDSTSPILSHDGLVVAFVSAATDLVAGDTNGATDVFVREIENGLTIRASVATGGAQADGPSAEPSLSGDGDVIAFESTATNLVAGDSNGVADVFVRARGSAQTSRVSVSDAGAESDAASGAPSISEDGDRVVFASAATNLSLGDMNANQDVFLRQRTASRTVLLSTSTTGSAGNADTSQPALSANGLHAAFASSASDLVTADTNVVEDVFLRPVHDLPTLTAVSPTAGTPLGGTALTLTGTGFQANGAGTASVFVDGVAATNVVTVNDATITCDSPTGTGGATVDVVMVNANGSGILAAGYAYRSTPTVTSVSPLVGPATGGTAITLTGSGFTNPGFGSNTVTFDGVSATNVVTINDTTITCDSPAGTPGATVDVAVTNLNGTGTSNSAFSYHAPPTLTSVSPATGHADGGDSITLTGTGFTANGAGTNTVTFGGVPAMSVVTVDDATITCASPAGTAGAMVDVGVSNASGTALLAGGFRYNPEPALSSISPVGGSPLGGTSITLTGTGFQNSSIGTTTVTFGGASATNLTVVSETSVTCTAPAGSAGSTVAVEITNANGSSLLAGAYTFNGPPNLASVAPGAGTSLGGTALVLTGTGFQNNSIGTTLVTVDGAAATNVVVVNDSTVNCDSPAGPPSTTADVAITNGNGSSTLASSFVYHPSPTIASISPPDGAAAGGTTITISGTGFVANEAGANAVSVGGSAATDVVALNNTTLTCRTPAAAGSGAVDVVVSNANGSALQVGGYTYNLEPSVVAIAPAAGSSLGGTAVTLTGTGFLDNGAGVNNVTFDGVSAMSVTALSDTAISCVTPIGAAGSAVDVAVSNANGTGVLSSGFTYHPTPVVSTIVPSSGSPLGGTGVTVTGSGFVAGDAGTISITIGGNLAINVVVLSDTSLTCDVPSGAAGTAADVVVSNDNGSGTLAAGFAYFSSPTVTNLSPGAGSAVQATSVTLTGTGFTANAAGTNTVTFGGATAMNVTVLSDTTLTCDTPTGSAGATVDVVVLNDNGSGTLSSAFSYHPSPTLTSVTPSTGSSLGGTTITLTGTGFSANDAGSAMVLVDGIAATGVLVVSDTTITCDTPAGASGTTVSVVVENANGSGSLGSAFAYHPDPTLTSVAPGTGSSLGGAMITLSGSGFLVNGAGPAMVLVGGSAATSVTVQGDATVTCDTPAGPPGTTVDVELQNANGNVTLPGSFSYYPTPTVASVSPSGGTPVGGTSVTLSGTGFLANGAGMNSVSFDGNAATAVVVVNDNTLTCTTPAGASGAIVDVEVTNDNGSGVGSGLFTYQNSPAVTSVSPAEGTSLGGGAITVTGTGFVNQGAGSNTVTFDGAAAGSVVVVSDTEITCAVPAGTAGLAADVTVTNDNGAGTLSGGFQYFSAPAITTVTPEDGPLSGGTNLTITGVGFTANSAGPPTVTVDGMAATAVAALDDTTITCASPAGTPAAVVDVTVQNANGTGTLTGGFRYHAALTLATISPSSGTSLGGTSVTLTGTGFQDEDPGANAVTFGGIAATNVVVSSETTLTCDSPAGTQGTTVDVALSNANGSGQLSSAFTYHPLPTLASLSPTVGSSLGGTSVTLTGTGFTDSSAIATTVTFGGNAASNLVVVSDTTITCDTPPGAPATAVDVTLSNSNGSATLSAAFIYHATPTVTGVVPAEGPAAGGTGVTLSGEGFVAGDAGANAVTFGGTAATSVVVVSDTIITCDSPVGGAGSSVTVAVSNANGSGALSPGFTYHPAPTVAAVVPPAGPAAGGTTVMLTGSGFSDNAPGANTVTFAGVAATNVVVVSDTSITCDTPPGTSATDADVAVQNLNGAETLTGGYRYRSDVTGDLDDDGIADLLIGAPGTNSGDGVAVVFLGDDLGLIDAGAAAADLTVASTASGASLGTALAAADLNGDGAIDLIVGSPTDSAVHVFYGPQSTPASLSTGTADVSIDGLESDDDFGAAIAVGDVDQDGEDDLIVGAPLSGADDRGRVYVFLGGTGFAPTRITNATVVLEGLAGERFGTALAIGDVDGDANIDLAGGAPGADRAYVFFDGSGLTSDTTSNADATLRGGSSGDDFGGALAIGDVGRSPTADLIVGAALQDGGGTDAGRAYIYFGSASFTSQAPGAADMTVSAESAGDHLGAAVRTGDLDGDGRAELVLGASHYDEGMIGDVGRVYVFLGGSLSSDESAANANARYTGELVSGEHFGASLVVLDLDDDGFGDLAVGAPEADGPGTDAGRVYVFLGATLLGDESAATDDATFSGGAAGDSLGASLTSDGTN